MDAVGLATLLKNWVKRTQPVKQAVDLERTTDCLTIMNGLNAKRVVRKLGVGYNCFPFKSKRMFFFISTVNLKIIIFFVLLFL